MTRRNHPLRLCRLLGLAGLLMLPAGCASLDRSVALAEQVVTPIAVGDASDVSAYDLAEAMLRAGFTRQQILKDGPAIHNALAKSGGAQVRYGRVAAALFAVHGENLYVTSLTRGTFTQHLDQLVLVGAEDAR